MRRMRQAGWVRRVVAALLALALLALPGAPLRHAAAMPHPADMARHAAPEHPCTGTTEAAAPHYAPDRAPGDAQGALPGLACCVSALCAGLQGPPPAAPALPLALIGALPRTTADAPGVAGRVVPPALPPPRRA